MKKNRLFVVGILLVAAAIVGILMLAAHKLGAPPPHHETETATGSVHSSPAAID